MLATVLVLPLLVAFVTALPTNQAGEDVCFLEGFDSILLNHCEELIPDSRGVYNATDMHDLIACTCLTLRQICFNSRPPGFHEDRTCELSKEEIQVCEEGVQGAEFTVPQEFCGDSLKTLATAFSVGCLDINCDEVIFLTDVTIAPLPVSWHAEEPTPSPEEGRSTNVIVISVVVSVCGLTLAIACTVVVSRSNARATARTSNVDTRQCVDIAEALHVDDEETQHVKKHEQTSVPIAPVAHHGDVFVSALELPPVSKWDRSAPPLVADDQPTAPPILSDEHPSAPPREHMTPPSNERPSAPPVSFDDRGESTTSFPSLNFDDVASDGECTILGDSDCEEIEQV